MKEILLFLWLRLTALVYRQGYGWPWMQKQIESIADKENYKVEMRRQKINKGVK
jgi:hypothetical protein